MGGEGRNRREGGRGSDFTRANVFPTGLNTSSQNAPWLLPCSPSIAPHFLIPGAETLDAGGQTINP